MVPRIIVEDPQTLDFYGQPERGAKIYNGYIQVHPTSLDKVVEGLIAMFGDIFTVMTIEEYNEIKKNNSMEN